MDNIFNLLNIRTTRFVTGIAESNGILDVYGGLNFNSKYRVTYDPALNYYCYARDSQTTPHTITCPANTKYVSFFIYTLSGSLNTISVNGTSYSINGQGSTIVLKQNTSNLDISITASIGNVALKHISYT